MCVGGWEGGRGRHEVALKEGMSWWWEGWIQARRSIQVGLILRKVCIVGELEKGMKEGM